MGYTFDVEMNSFPDNVDDDTTAAAIETWIDSLDIPSSRTIYEISREHHCGFWKIIIIYGEN